MKGMDVRAATGLAEELSGWRHNVAGVRDVVIEAESLSAISSGAAGLLAQIGRDGQSMASAISRASSILQGHRLVLTDFQPRLQLGLGSLSQDAGQPAETHSPTRSTSRRRNRAAAGQAQVILDRIRSASAHGRAPNPGDHARLQAIFGAELENDTAATAALGLALRGLPASRALTLRRPADVAVIFGTVAELMGSGVAPATTAVPVELFPRGYREWHRLQAEIDSTRNERHSANARQRTAIAAHVELLRAEQAALRLTGLDRDAIAVDDQGSVSAIQAIASAANYFGHHSHGWAGKELAPAASGSWGTGPQVKVGSIGVRHRAVAMSMFNQLGATGTGRLPGGMLHHGPDFFALASPTYAQALAQISQDSNLAFTGRELIEANTAHHLAQFGALATPRLAEFLLLDDGFDESFLVDAVTASLRIRPEGVHAWSRVDGQIVDPRPTALLAAVLNNAMPAVVHRLDDSDDLPLLLDPATDGGFVDGSFATEHHLLPAVTGGLSPVHVAVAQIGEDVGATQRVLHHIQANPDMYGENDGNHLPIRDLRIANGLSSALATAAPSFVHQSGANQDRFFHAYDLVLLSGSGHDLAVAAEASLFEEEVRWQARAGTAIGVGALIAFIIRALVMRKRVRHQNASTADAAADNLNNLLSRVGLGNGVVGLGASAVSAPAVATGASIFGVLLGVASLFSPDSNELEEFWHEEYRSATHRTSLTQRQILMGALASGTTTTATGSSVSLTVAEPEIGDTVMPSFTVSDDRTGRVLYHGSFLDAQGHFTLSDGGYEPLLALRLPGDDTLRELITRLDSEVVQIDLALELDTEHGASGR